MAIDENAAIVQLMKDFQDSRRRVGALTHAVNTRVKAIAELSNLMREDIGQVKTTQGGFTVPHQVIVDRKTIAMESVSTEKLHEELSQLIDAQDEAHRIEACVRSAGFPDLTAT